MHDPEATRGGPEGEAVPRAEHRGAGQEGAWTGLPPAGQEGAPEVEHRYHSYVGTRIPWFVHLLWLGFWVLAVWYILSFLFPDLQKEFSQSP